MKEEYMNGSTLAMRFTMPWLLLPSLFVLGGFLESNRDVILVLSVMAVAQAAFLWLIRNPISSRFASIILMILSFLFGFFLAMFMSTYAECKLTKSYALIFGIVLLAIVFDSYRIFTSKKILFPAGYWAGLCFQTGLLLYSFLTL